MKNYESCFITFYLQSRSRILNLTIVYHSSPISHPFSLVLIPDCVQIDLGQLKVMKLDFFLELILMD
ncbi:unnamed protein product [Lathyrus oleraceus]